MEELKKKAADIAIKHGKACIIELAVECAFPLIEAAVAKSETKIDDVVLSALEEPAKKVVLEFLASLGIKK